VQLQRPGIVPGAQRRVVAHQPHSVTRVGLTLHSEVHLECILPAASPSHVTTTPSARDTPWHTGTNSKNVRHCNSTNTTLSAGYAGCALIIMQTATAYPIHCCSSLPTNLASVSAHHSTACSPSPGNNTTSTARFATLGVAIIHSSSHPLLLMATACLVPQLLQYWHVLCSCSCHYRTRQLTEQLLTSAACRTGSANAAVGATVLSFLPSPQPDCPEELPPVKSKRQRGSLTLAFSNAASSARICTFLARLSAIRTVLRATKRR
jgi:hypothetical protein